MERDVDKLRKEIAKRYEEACRSGGLKRHDKLYFNIIEPVAGKDLKSGIEGGERKVVSISIIYRGNYKMYFKDRLKDIDMDLLC